MEEQTERESGIMPLHFDGGEPTVDGCVNIIREWDYETKLHTAIERQLAERPNVWGVGLWPDPRMEKVARKCAEVLACELLFESSNFIPEDSVLLLLKSEIDHAAVAIEGIEEAFHCLIDVENLDKLLDFSLRDIVDEVLATRGRFPPKEKIGLFHDWGKSKLGIMPNLIIYVVWPLAVIVTSYKFHSFARRNFPGSPFSSIWLIFGALLLVVMMTLLYNGKKYGRDYVYGNILRFFLSFIVGSVIYMVFRK